MFARRCPGEAVGFCSSRGDRDPPREPSRYRPTVNGVTSASSRSAVRPAAGRAWCRDAVEFLLNFRTVPAVLRLACTLAVALPHRNSCSILDLECFARTTNVRSRHQPGAMGPRRLRGVDFDRPGSDILTFVHELECLWVEARAIILLLGGDTRRAG
jgi:hypothetical protein